MKYMGSKARWAKYILPLILSDRQPGSLYVEPFVGGANTFHLVDGPKWGNDTNLDVVAMLDAVGNWDWVPPDHVPEDEYERLKHDLSDRALRGFVGIGCSYSGKWFGGYARGSDSKGNDRNYCAESKRNLLRQKPGLSGAKFTSGEYWEMDIPPGSVVYCDPPYRATTQYSGVFDSDKFWEWAAMLAETCAVVVSEFEAPSGWDCIWEAERNTSLTRNTGAKRAVEKLWVPAWP